MILYLLRRLAIAIPTMFGVSIIAFGMIRLIPGDPALLLMGERGATPELYAEMKAQLGLDKPLIVQYGKFIYKAIQGDMGRSIITKKPVSEEFWDRFPATLELGLSGIIIAVILGIPLGIIAALKRNTFFDYSIMGVSLVGYSMPIFWWGLVLIMVFSVTLGWTPVSGRIDYLYEIDSVTGFLLIDSLLSKDGLVAFWSALRHLFLPALVLGTIPLAIIARMTRSSLLEVMGEDYIRTAKAKGLDFFNVVIVHALRNAMIPVLTVIGLMVGTTVTGAILTETIFSWPGIGRWLVISVNARDYPVIQGGILYIAVSVMLVNLLVDLSYAVVNPKMREQGG